MVQEDETTKPILDGVSLSLKQGQTVCLVGESGAGKSMTASSIMRLLPYNASITRGEVWFEEQNLLSLPDKAMNRIRGNRMSMVFQQPVSSLNPIMAVGKQVEEVFLVHTNMGRKERKQQALEMLAKVRFDDPERIAKQYAQQLSGGQAQRVMLAIALALRPRLLIADEPTTALDTSTQAEILNLLRELQQAYQLSILLITHDMAVVRAMADQIVVIREGKIVEEGTVSQIFEEAHHAYTQELVQAAAIVPPEPIDILQPMLQATNISKRHWVKRNLLDRQAIDAVIDVSITLNAGETLALVGRSGSGKTTLGKAITCLDSADSGCLLFKEADLYTLRRRERQAYLRYLQLVFQNPRAAFNPNIPIWRSILEGLVIHKIGTAAERKDMLTCVLAEVGLTEQQAKRLPGEVSGGQLQRAAIARALIVEPKIVVLDEPVSALDVMARANILHLLKRLQQRRQLTLLLITHNMLVVREMAHRVAVMHAGKIVEVGTNPSLFDVQQHPQTKALIDAVPGDWLAPS